MTTHNASNDEASAALAQVAAETSACTHCDLHIGAHRSAPGVGPSAAEVMLIGEAPSAYDDRSGAPFTGPSGVFLDELLAAAGMSRPDVYLTNLVKHHPPDNRELRPDEIAACAGYLVREIAAVSPILIVTLGRGALQWFLPSARISSQHGQARLHRGRILLAMYNPAAGLHREELHDVIVADFTRALPAALAEARRLLAAGKLAPHAPAREDDSGPQQMSLF
ncbi:MAG TPA: uracil-DNA glycosylase [Ktedonobacterales bacterium]|nr:uracil-DNA glycosylase [Ktedonobacterales bacterium]